MKYAQINSIKNPLRADKISASLAAGREKLPETLEEALALLGREELPGHADYRSEDQQENTEIFLSVLIKKIQEKA